MPQGEELRRVLSAQTKLVIVQSNANIVLLVNRKDDQENANKVKNPEMTVNKIPPTSIWKWY